METYGPHLDNILIGETRMKWALLNMSRAICRDDEAISEEAIAAEKLLAQPGNAPRSGSSRPNWRLSNSAGFSRL